nr:venom dipeptidyl peptidase 4 isoform X1 [Bactrocera oleae]
MPTNSTHVKYLPATHAYIHHCKQQQQQKQQQQLLLQHPQQSTLQSQRCVMRIPMQQHLTTAQQQQQQLSLAQQQQQPTYAAPKPQQYQYHNNNVSIHANHVGNHVNASSNMPLYVGSTSSVGIAGAELSKSGGPTVTFDEFTEFYWPHDSKQQQQHQALQKQQQHQHATPHNNCNNIDIGGVDIGISAVTLNEASIAGANATISSTGGRTFITPADIPPPPPHPPNITARKRHLGASKSVEERSTRDGGRCQCEHPIEFVVQQQQQQQQQQLQPAQLPQVSLQQQQAHQSYGSHHSVYLPAQQQPQQQQQQQQTQPTYRPHTLNQCSHNSDYNHLPPPPPATLTRADSHRSHHNLMAVASSSYYKNRFFDDAPLPPPSHLSTSSLSSKTTFETRQLKNLGYAPMKIRKLRIILGTIAALIVIALLAVALTFIIKAGDDDDVSPQDKDNGLHLDEVITGALSAHRFNGTWTPQSRILFRENNNPLKLQSIVEYDVKTKKKRVLLYDEHRQYSLFEMSADRELLLLAKNLSKYFRHSFFAQYDIYNITSGQIQPLMINGVQQLLLFAQWAPVGNGLIINFERNLYYKPTAYAEAIPLTSDESIAILNGIPDWVYEEEVFSTNIATWFNPTGTHIAFIKFDDSPTHAINLPIYGEANEPRFQYPLTKFIPYPKAGSSNPRVSLYTVDLARAAKGLEFLTQIPVPSSLNTETDYIISAVEWLDNERVLSVWMNRIQNLAYLQVFDGVRRLEIYNIESKTGWVNLFTPPFKNRDGSRIALVLPQLQDDQTYYRQICTLSTKTSGGAVETLTKGKYVVEGILHWDAASDVIFYMANTEQQSQVAHVYAIKADTGRTPQCLTCGLHVSGDVQQTYYEVSFSDERQMAITSDGPGIPMTVLYEWNWENDQVVLKKVIDWELNTELRAKLKLKAMPTYEIHTFPIAGNFTAKVLLQLPPNLDRSGNTKYPLLVDVYGGPDSTSVLDRWMIDWGTYLSSNQSVIYAKIDGRGSGSRGDKLLHSVYLKLGTVEITDQVDVTRQLQQKFSFIDANHTGIWGWSYGGYAAAMALANDDSQVFRCAASVAPVTDWAYYDSIYTERYMSLPKLNEVGYANSQLTTRAQRLRGKKFMLIHGTLDDNVHYQQAMVLAKNLERLDILFKQISYTDEDHSLASVRPHLYHSLDRFFGDCFGNKRMMSRWNGK